jgi:hypothetical protein
MIAALPKFKGNGSYDYQIRPSGLKAYLENPGEIGSRLLPMYNRASWLTIRDGYPTVFWWSLWGNPYFGVTQKRFCTAVGCGFPKFRSVPRVPSPPDPDRSFFHLPDSSLVHPLAAAVVIYREIDVALAITECRELLADQQQWLITEIVDTAQHLERGDAPRNYAIELCEEMTNALGRVRNSMCETMLANYHPTGH